MNLRNLLRFKAAGGNGGGGTVMAPKCFSATALANSSSTPALTNTRGTTLSTTDGAGRTVTVTQVYDSSQSATSYANGQVMIDFEGLKDLMEAEKTIVFSANITITENPAEVVNLPFYTNGNGTARYVEFAGGKLNYTVVNNIRDSREYLEIRCSGCSFTLSNVKLTIQ